MAICKETTFFNKWTRTRELKPGKHVFLSANSGSYLVGLPAHIRSAKVESPLAITMTVSAHRGIYGEVGQGRHIIGQNKINQADLTISSPLRFLGIRSRIVFREE